jgi:protein ImuB
MSRIVSVWLPNWPIYRFLSAQASDAVGKPVDPERPFVLAIAATGGLRIAAANEMAEAAGIALGDPLTDARAKAISLQVRAADSAADDAALRRLTLWATRYTPTASPWDQASGGDGFFLDIEGAAHLFGGEASLLADLAARLDRFGYPTQLAVAATPGMAWALSHFHSACQSILPSGGEANSLSGMPVEALRLSSETRILLRRLGLKSVSSLLDKPRAPLAARFNGGLLRRLDQALGRIDEPLVPVTAPPVYHSLNYLLEPTVHQQAIVARTRRLMQNLVHALERDQVGARALRLRLYGLDGAVETVDIGLTSPTRNVAHVTWLVELKLDTLAAMQDCDFGFEAIGLAVTRAEPMPAQQIELKADRHARAPQDDDDERCAALIDALRQRLGVDRVRHFEAVPSHIPERAETLRPIEGTTATAWPEPEQPRPLLLLPQAEPAEVTALVPDGPPRRLRWRGVTYEIAGAQGPERIAAEWWRVPPPYPPPQAEEEKGGDLTRDYFFVEDDEGHRFWLYREGLYDRETSAARWFVHGLFA